RAEGLQREAALAAGHAQPNEVINRLRERRIVCVQGEADRQVVRALRKASSMKERLGDDRFDEIARAHEALTSDNIEFLRALPRARTIPIEQVHVHLCHGTVASQSDAMQEHDSIERFRRQREAANTEIVICGSDGPAFIRWVDLTLFANPGSMLANTLPVIAINTDTEPFHAEMLRAPMAG
ncbi:MAG TPA: metallophosphoesterase family protein, partial [Candidatus Hydrogenedentes bacterium]|nr:metallophosphoesterase family protein [Candidatus Hydrogenedentota bacterium]